MLTPEADPLSTCRQGNLTFFGKVLSDNFLKVVFKKSEKGVGGARGLHAIFDVFT